MTKAKRITLVTVTTVLVLLIIAATALSFIKADDGFNTGAEPFQAQIVKNGAYTATVSVDSSHAVVNKANDGAAYDKFVDEYYGMTTYSIMRGIVEGKWNPKAKLEAVLTSADLKTLAAAAGEYLVAIDYTGTEGEEQQAEIKVMKGTKEDPNKVVIDGETFNEGDKVSFKFTTIVLIIEENNFINDLTLYAFEKSQLSDVDFVAYQIVVKANQIGLYQVCKEILP